MITDAKHPASILVATDFSSPGTRATDFAAALARARGARICLLHVFEPPSVTVPELALDPRFENDLRNSATEKLGAAATTMRALGVEVDERLEVGSPPAQVIAAVATELDPVMVVLGSHGRRPVPRLLMGSVAEGALLRIQQPVLVVPDERAGATPKPPAGRPWRIAVGLDQSTSSAAAVDWIRDLRRHAAVDVTFIHIYWPAAEYTRFGLQGPRDLFEPDPLTIELLRKSLSPLIAGLPGHGEVALKIIPNWGSTGQRLTEEAVQANADLLVLGTHHRQGFSRLLHGSTVPPALHAGRLPIVCVSRSPRQKASLSSSTIPHLRNIVAATDLSELGNRAVAHAYALARADRGVVHLLYVHERLVPRPAYAYAPDSANALRTDETDALLAQLHALVPADAGAQGIATDVIIADGGGAAEVICQTAERHDADAICLASHGRGGLSKLVLGSVAGQVVHQAARPVFLVRQSSQ